MLEGLGRIKVPKSSDVLAERLKQEILSDAYGPGSALPTERELVSATGLSRGSVREALRILEAQGLVHTRAGGARHEIGVAAPAQGQIFRHRVFRLEEADEPGAIGRQLQRCQSGFRSVS